MSPAQLAEGEFDSISTLEDLHVFFAKLPNGDRQLSVLVRTAHSVIVSRSHKVLQHGVQAFLSVPGVLTAG